VSENQEGSAGNNSHRPAAGRGGQRLAVGIALVALIVSLCALLLATGACTGLPRGEKPDPTTIQVDAATFQAYFGVEAKSLSRDGGALLLTLKRAKGFPLDDDDFDALAEKMVRGVPALLALEAVARGYVRCEYFTEKDEFLGFTFARIRDLAKRETIELSLPIAGRRGLARIVLTY